MIKEKIVVLFSLFLFTAQASAESLPDKTKIYKEDFFFSGEALQEESFYSDEHEIKASKQLKCKDSKCNTAEYKGHTVYHAVIINDKTFEDILIGYWSLDGCKYDQWKVFSDGSFYAQAEDDPPGTVFDWKGTYKFENDVYIEKGIYDKTPMDTEALLYFVPAKKIVIFKTLKLTDDGEVVDMTKEDGYFYYEYCDKK